MTQNACFIDGKPLGLTDREHVCVVCARKVCSEHSTGDRLNPHTGESGRACQRCLGQTVDDEVKAQVGWLHRQLTAWQRGELGPALEALHQIQSSLARIEARLISQMDPPAVPPHSKHAKAPTGPKRTRPKRK